MGNLFIADMGSKRVLEVNPAGQATTVSPTFPKVYAPSDVALDSAGNLFIADPGGDDIVCVPVYGDPFVVFTNVTLSGVAHVAVDESDTLYATQAASNAIWKIPFGGVAQQITNLGLFQPSWPEGLAVDASGTLYVADTLNGRVTAITAGGVPSAVPTGALEFSNPSSIAIDPLGNLYVSDNAPNLVIEIPRSSAPQLTFSPELINTNSDPPQAAEFLNAGNASLTFGEIFFPADFIPEGSESPECAVGVELAPGAECSLNIGFEPVNGGSLNEDVFINYTGNSPGENVVEVSGTGNTI
jgi:hypothetical protein